MDVENPQNERGKGVRSTIRQKASRENIGIKEKSEEELFSEMLAST